MKTREVKLFLYQPVILKDKQVCNCIFGLPFMQVKEGDLVATEKRPGTSSQMKSQHLYKIVNVTINAFDASIIATLEPVKFQDEKEMNRYLDGKSKIV